MAESFIPSEFRVYLLPSPPGEAAYVPVRTLGEAIAALEAMVQLRINLDERFEMGWNSDISGLEYKDPEGDWVEFADIKGNIIDDYYNRKDNGLSEIDLPVPEDKIWTTLLSEIVER